MVTSLRSQAYLVSPSQPSKICLPLWGTGKCQDRGVRESDQRERESKVWELQEADTVARKGREGRRD